MEFIDKIMEIEPFYRNTAFMMLGIALLLWGFAVWLWRSSRRDRKDAAEQEAKGLAIAAQLREEGRGAEAALVTHTANAYGSTASMDLKNLEAVGVMFLFGVAAVVIGAFCLMLGAA